MHNTNMRNTNMQRDEVVRHAQHYNLVQLRMSRRNISYLTGERFDTMYILAHVIFVNILGT